MRPPCLQPTPCGGLGGAGPGGAQCGQGCCGAGRGWGAPLGLACGLSVLMPRWGCFGPLLPCVSCFLSYLSPNCRPPLSLLLTLFPGQADSSSTLVSLLASLNLTVLSAPLPAAPCQSPDIVLSLEAAAWGGVNVCAWE